MSVAPAMNESSQRVYRFADVEVDTALGCLRRDGQEQHLRQQTFQVLLHLLEQRERLVTKDELIERIWQGAAVTDNALVQCITDLRKALGDDSRQPRLIKTIPKAGYRFIGTVEEHRPRGSAHIETKEITTVEIEYEEEESEEETERQRDKEIRELSLTLPLAPSLPRSLASSPRRSIVLLCALAGLLVAASSTAVYVGKSLWFRQRPDVVLPQVPGKKPVAVMYFENQSGSRELDWLREGLADMLIANLSRSKKLSVLSRQQLSVLLGRIGHQGAERIRLEEALEIARKTQAEVIALGSFAQLGEKMRLDVQLHDGRTGQLLTTESLIADKPEQILTQVDLLSLKLAGHLGAPLAEQQQKTRLTDVMTDNLEAYRYYSLALEKAHAFHSVEAIQLLEKAVALDPQFAMAQARIGYVYLQGGFANEDEKARRYLEKAFQLSHRLTERDRLYINAWYAYGRQDSESAIRGQRELVSQYPLDVENYYTLSYMLRNQARLQEAIEVIQQGLIADPEAPDLYNRLGFCYLELGRYSEAVAAHQRYVQLAPREANAYDSLGMTYNEMGRFDDALAAFSQALTLEPNFHLAIMHTGDVYFRLGRYRAAAEEYERCLALTPASYHRSTGYYRLAYLYLRKGDLVRAEAAAQQSLRHLNWHGAFLVAVARGDLKNAEKIRTRFLNSPGGGAHIDDRWVSYGQALSALKGGRADEAIENFKETLRQPPVIWNIDGISEDCLAQAYLELGRLDEAIAEYQRVLRLNPNWPLAHYHLGQAYERKGERAQARAAYERFLQIWKDADPDLPEIVAAKARLAS